MPSRLDRALRDVLPRPRPRWRPPSDDPRTARPRASPAARAPRGARPRPRGVLGGPILANPPCRATRPSRRSRAAPPRPPDPHPVVLPRDDGPHDRLTEWWYYTGHLRARGRAPVRLRVRHLPRRARRRSPSTWASHLALTDETGDRFLYAQRIEIGPQVDRCPGEGRRTDRVRLRGHGVDLADPDAAAGHAWTMDGSLGRTPSRPTASGERGGRRSGERLRPGPAPARRASRRRSTTATAGSTSGRPAAPTTTRGPRWTRPAR